ncbi:nitroreductase family protein [Desulfopila inferna]|nr:nitroreductase family protein [Desulfopila inferna]
MMKNIIEKTRTFRKFDATAVIDASTVEKLIELGRLGGSARNCQPWQYRIVTDAGECASVFPHLGWAGYLTDWKGPEERQRPTAYILCYLNREWLKGSLQEAHFDLGIASQNMLLGATEAGLGGCRILAFSKKLAAEFPQPEHLELQLVIALGVPAEKVVIEECSDYNIKYWRDGNQTHHVPKRRLQDILLQP